ncbi:CD209 antigen-like protein C [Grammomys surdaster]|uniref:CD209 antigen-like protein C n=1 Tax=Grammomys surdaster TaxID=491861 RepID=UPI0010A0793A|nr:CD209 antigen-like protein C [Grammomys surdaster]XP_028641352.1 CD209 antigen-like protein C [Grammomys surdaster]
MIVSMEANKKQPLGPLGCLRYSHGLVVLHLFSIVLLAGLLVAVLVQGLKGHSSSENEKIYKQLMQLETGVDSLCRPCPWEWTFFHRKCYYFSKSQRNWNDSITACQEVEAHLVIVESDEEQTFLSSISKDKGDAWMALSDLKQEGMWQWVDGSPLSRNYWSAGEPNNKGNEDCAIFSNDGWNDIKCSSESFWICKKPASPCPK